jgi:hypothetical protein
MTFNFAQTCENTNISGSGIAAKECAIGPFQNQNLTDETPVVVGSIDILELDEDLKLITQSSLFGTYRNGDSFSYTSTSNDPSKINTTAYPTAIQISIIGNNKDGESLFFAGLIEYATECNGMPSLDEASSIGWITFSNLEPPQTSVCPLSAVPTTSPTSFTKAPVIRPPPTTHASEKDPRPSSVPSIPTQKPSCLFPSYSSKGYSKKISKGSKSGKSGKGKGSKSSKGSGSIRSYSYSMSEVKGKGKGSKSHNNIFYHGQLTECEDSPSSAPPKVTHAPVSLSKDDEMTRAPVHNSNDNPTAKVEPSNDSHPSKKYPVARNGPLEDDDVSYISSNDSKTEDYRENVTGVVVPSQSDEQEFAESSGYYALLTLVTILAVAGAMTMYFWPIRKSLQQKKEQQCDSRKREQESQLDEDDRTTYLSSVLSSLYPDHDDPLLSGETKGLFVNSGNNCDRSLLRL